MNKKNISDKERYIKIQERKEKEWEDTCISCGACCGVVEGDPCEHLHLSKNNKYCCDIYKNRFGIHKTKRGRDFRCVPIRKILDESWPGDKNCAYKLNFKTNNY